VIASDDPGDTTAPSAVAIYSPSENRPAGFRSYIFTRASDETGVLMFRYSWSADRVTWNEIAAIEARANGEYWDGSIYPWETSALPEGGVWFRATAVDAGYNETSAEIFIVLDHTPPGAPQNLTASPAEARVVLAWDAVAADDLATYRIYRSTTESGSFTSIDIQGLTYSDTGVAIGQVNFYRVVAVDNAQNESTCASAFAIPLADVTPPGITSITPAEAAVIGKWVILQATGTDNGRIVRFDFEYYDENLSEWVSIGSDSYPWYYSYYGRWEGSMGWSTTTLQSGAVTVRVTAVDTGGNGTSAERMLVIDHEPPPVPET
jgi:hypothetical protein